MNEDVNIFIKPMERKAFSEIPSPKLVSDWKGLTIVTKQMMTSGIITIEKGTIMKVQSAGKRLCLVGDLCQCCGIKPYMTIIGDRKYKESKIQFLENKE